MGFVRKTVGAITGETAADAAQEGAQLQAESIENARQDLLAGKEQGQGFLQPFSQLGQQGLEQSSFLTDPQAQFDFLQNNPLFQLGLDNANTQTLQSAAARGRLSSGDTLQQLNQNALLTASPLIANQQNAIQNLLNTGLNTAQSQANTALGVGSQLAGQQTQLGNALAAGQIGAANAQAGGAQNLIDIGGSLLGSNIGQNLLGKIGL